MRRSSVLALMSVAAVVTLFPLIYMFSMSFTSTFNAYDFHLIPQDPTLTQYATITKGLFPRWALNTIIFAVVVTLGQVLFDSLCGFALAKLRFPGRGLLLVVVLTTIMLPAQMIVIANFIILKRLGWLDTYQGLIVPHLAAGFGIFLMRQFMLEVPDELLDAARIDGASDLRMFFTVVLPICKPAMSVVAIWNFLWCWNEFLWPLVVVSSPSMVTLTVGLASFQQKNLNDWGLIMAGAMVSFLPVLVVFLAFQRNFIRGIAMAGMGGR